jgi:HlyD family secretion protein
MTANAAIITEQKEKVLRIPNAALRFKMPESVSPDAIPAANKTKSDATTPAAAGAKNPNKPYLGGSARVMTRKVWVLAESGLKKKPVQKTIRVGVSDGSASEVISSPDNESGSESNLKPGDLVIIGVSNSGTSATQRMTGPRLF